jgi:universal stress protein E
MSPDIAVNMGRWYLRWDKGEIFQVTEQDPDTGSITICTYDGRVDHLSPDEWRDLQPGLADPPCDWTGAVETVDELQPNAALPPGFTAPVSTANPIKRILVAIKELGGNWSPGVAKATQIACATGAQVELFHCVDADVTVQELATYEAGIDEFEGGQRRPWEQGLERLATQVRRHGVHVSFSAPVDHPVHEAIVRQARRFHADLIITDAHKGPNFAPSLLQEVDWELIRLSTVPVLIVRRPQPYHHPIVLAALDPRRNHSKPAALDDKILGLAQILGNALHGELHAIHAYTVPAAYAEASAVAGGTVAAELQAIDAQSAQAALDTLLTASGIVPERRHILQGSPADAIVRTANDMKASLVVMGSVARSGVGGFFIGNSAEKVLSQIPCDLLLLKPDGFSNSIPDQRRGARVISVAVYP